MNNQLTIKQRKAVIALLQEPTIEKAAEQTGVNLRTMFRYLTDKDFRDELRRQETQMLAGVKHRYLSALTSSLNTLLLVMESNTASESAKVSASKAINDYYLRLCEKIDTDDRLSALEEIVFKRV